MFEVAVGNELEDLGDNILLQHLEIMFDDRPASSLLPFGQTENARADRRHLRAEIERVDRAKQAAAEGRARRGERAISVDREFCAVGGQPGHERRCDRASQIASERSRAKKQDLRLIGIDEFRHAPRVGLVAVVGEDRGFNEIGDIGAIGEGVLNRLPRTHARSAQDNARELNAELVGEFAALTQKLPRNGVNMTAFKLYEDPHMFVGLEALRQFLLHPGSAASGRLGSGFCSHEIFSLWALALRQLRQFLLERRQPLENFFECVRRHLVG